MELFDKLCAHFPPERVSWRVGSTNADKTKGLALAYIDARDVMERLDSVVGPADWQCRYPHANGKTVCEIGVKLNGEWVWKADGAGDTDVEAEKGALSDAFKRAAVRWGIGRYLYDLDSPWVALEARGKSYIIKDSEHARLRALLSKGAPSAAPPVQTPADHPGRSFVEGALSDIAAVKTADALTVWADANKGHVRALPDDLQAQLRDAWTARMKQLKTKEAA